MSDAAVATIVGAAVNIIGMVVGFLTLWVKLKYGVQKAEEAATKAQVVETKIDRNTDITTEAKDAAAAGRAHADICGEEIKRLSQAAIEHHGRISALETQMAAIKGSMDAANKNIDSTRHEMRGHLETVARKLDIMSLSLKPSAESK